MTIRKQRDLVIENGPGKWDMILSLFEGKRVFFKFEEQGRTFDRHSFIITGVSFYEIDRKWCHFRTLFPYESGGSAHFSTDGFINLLTRKGYICVDPTPGATAKSPEEWKYNKGK